VPWQFIKEARIEAQGWEKSNQRELFLNKQLNAVLIDHLVGQGGVSLSCPQWGALKKKRREDYSAPTR
jgi:hypothetical protein